MAFDLNRMYTSTVIDGWSKNCNHVIKTLFLSAVAAVGYVSVDMVDQSLPGAKDGQELLGWSFFPCKFMIEAKMTWIHISILYIKPNKTKYEEHNLGVYKMLMIDHNKIVLKFFCVNMYQQLC